MLFFGFIYLFSQMLLQQAANAAISPMTQDRDVSAIKAEVSLVPVFVSVRNKDGGFIDNLQAKDFVVYDNGVAQQIDLFSHEEMPLDVALVVDNSVSEKPYMLELQKMAMAVLQQLSPKNDRVALFCLNTRPIQMTDLTQDRLLLTRQLGKFPPLSVTKIKDALWKAALSLRSKGPHRRRAIILISDNNEYLLSAHSYKETLDEMLETGTILYSIQTTGNDYLETSVLDTEKKVPYWPRPTFLPGPYPVRVDANPREITLLAKETGGEVLDAKSPSDLSSALNKAILKLKHSYTLGFYPTDIGKEGSYHALKVKLNSNADYSAQARSGYYVPGPLASKIDQKVQASSAHIQNAAENALMEKMDGSSSLSMLSTHAMDCLRAEKKHLVCL
jgi:Ca-activated chloride channel homolog